ncbi:MAG TPA: type 1 glutamine amidotransferase [Streptosporangiaceae bacterium]|nr:type 1 glutamine amidotransferase [Streptosporangiaceae bacterium]
MRVIVVRHHGIDDAGFIGDAFVARGGEIAVHLFPDDGPLPTLDGVDHVIVLGAKWSVYDEATIGDWIGDELAWLREADQAGVPVLGICFGAQALSAALGGRVAPASRPEIGWTTVDSLDPQLVEPGPWLEFHSDQCLPPPDATLLARNDVGVQAFSLRRNLAVQFHPEVNGPQLRRWLEVGCAAEAKRAGLDPDKLVAQTVAEESVAAQRADRLVAAALRIAAQAGENLTPSPRQRADRR